MTDSAAPVDSAGRKKTKFSTDILKLASGTAIVQGISTLVSPFIARLYPPEAFGVFALFSSIVGVVVVVSTLRYDIAMMLPEHEEDAVNLGAAALLVSVLLSAGMALFIWAVGPALAELLNAPELAPYLWFAPPLVLFGGIGAGHPVLVAWASRSRKFSDISRTNVTGSAISMLLKLVFGFSGFNSGGGLIASTLFGSTVSPALLGWRTWKENSILFLRSVRLLRIWQNMKRYRKFVFFNTPSALLNILSWQAPAFLLSYFFSTTIVGYYAFGNQLLRMPMSLIGGSIGQAFFSHASSALHEGKLAEFVEKTFRNLVEYSFFPIMILSVIGRELCVVLFGEAWAEAGVYLQILSLWTVFWFISTPMIKLFHVLEKNEFALRIHIANFITRILSIWIGAIFESPRLALLLFSISGALVYGYLSVSIALLSGVSRRKLARILLQNFALLFIAGTMLLTLKLVHIPDWALVLAAAAMAGAYLLYRLKDHPYFAKVIGMFR